MANIKIKNLTEDLLLAVLDGEEYRIAEDESITVPSVEKGKHSLTLKRARFLSERSSEQPKIAAEEKSQYIQLSAKIEIEVEASRSVLVIKRELISVNRVGVDAFFSGFSAEISGGEIIAAQHTFANGKIKKDFTKRQLRDAIFPIGMGIIIFTALGLYALAANLAGEPITLGSRSFTYPWTFGLLAIDLGFAGYFASMLVGIFSTRKKFK